MESPEVGKSANVACEEFGCERTARVAPLCLSASAYRPHTTRNIIHHLTHIERAS